MRKIRLLSLLSVACAAAAVFVAAAPASASTVLCKKAESPCGSAQKYPGGQQLSASLSAGTKSKFSSGFAVVECSGSTLAATTQAEAGSPLPAEATGLTFTGCAAAGFEKCSAAGTNLPSGSSLVDKGGGNGELVAAPGGFEFTCTPLGSSPITCRYSSPSASFTVTGGAPATLTGTKLAFEKTTGSAFCSKTLTWSSAYNVSFPSPLYVSSGTGTEKVSSLCKEKVTFCPSASKYGVGQTLEASTSDFRYSNFGVGFECQSSLKGSVETAGGESVGAKISSGSFNCTSGPSWSCKGGSAEAESAKFASGLGGNGTLTLGNFSVKFECYYMGSPTPTNCSYTRFSVSLPVTGGVPAKIIGTEVPMSKQAGSHAICSNTISWTGTYSLTQPSPLYLTS